METVKKFDLEKLGRLFAFMDHEKAERFAKAWEEDYPQISEQIKQHGVPVTIITPVEHYHKFMPLYQSWGINIVQSHIFPENKVVMIFKNGFEFPIMSHE